MKESKQQKSTTVAGTDQVKAQDPQIHVDDISKVALNEDESIRIIITQFSNGQLQVGVKSKDRVPIPQLIGLTELAKNDFIQSTLQPAPPKDETVTFKLDQQDFDLDTEGYLKSQGLKPGDDFTMTKLMFDLREQSRKVKK